MKKINPNDYILGDGLTDEELAVLLRDPLVRICNLYWIEDADGNVKKFVPNEAQCAVLYQVYIKGRKRIAIPKARQLGFSTLIAIVEFDQAHFCEPDKTVRAVIIDKTAEDAQAKLAKIRFAWERLPEELRDATKADNKGLLSFANGSEIIAGLKARGRTPQVVHISEWGPIAYRDPERSKEIKAGVLQAASGANALIFAESTHEGGKGGDWYEMIKRSIETPEEHMTDADFYVMFFPWYLEPRYTLAGDVSQLDADTLKYFFKKEAELGIKFTDGQRLFYFKKKAELGRAIYTEFPTTLEECWMAPIVGAIYGPDIDKSRVAGRITNNVLHYEGFPVYSTFDIGAASNTICWLWQQIGDRINLLECLRGGDDCNTPAQWAKRLKAKAYTYGGHFLPHDGETQWRGLLVEAQVDGVVCLAKPVDVWDNINDALSNFSRCYFAKDACEYGLDSLEAYRAKEESDGVTLRNVPVHDWASHASTAFGYIHQAIRKGLCVDRSAMPKKPSNGKKVRAFTGLSSQRRVRSLR